ncbi:putative ribonuclease H-like domain-containing protein [Tanacetum coccineum]
MEKMYCLVVTDDYNRFSWVFFLATKDETSGILKSFITGIENLIDQRVKVIRYDNGTEFKNKEMNLFCERKCINSEFSIARTPQKNGVAERKIRTLIEAARTMLADSKLPTTFWAEAVNIACYVQNRVLVTKPHNKTPYELFLGRKPTLGFMRPFGYPVTILNTVDHLGKFDGKANEGFFVSLKSSPDVRFKPSRDDAKKVTEEPEKEGGDASKEDERDHQDVCADDLTMSELEEIGRFSDAQDDNLGLTLTIWIHTSKSVLIWRNVGLLVLLLNKEQIMKNFKTVCFLAFYHKKNPKKVIHALKDPSWIEAMHEELLQFKIQEVWTLVDLSKGKRAIGTKLVFKNKLDERGIMIRNKARLVTQGYTQEKGIEYDNVFAPVARIEAIMLFLAYASFKDFVVYQMDVKSAFLYGKIEEEVYVCQPPGFEDPNIPDRVYKVEKALMDCIKLPELGLQIASTPMETQKPLIKDEDGKEVDVHMYRSMIGSLMYLTSSRPNIMFAVCACARYQVNLKVSHLHAVKRIFRYLKGQPKLGLWYPKDSYFYLVAYTVSNYAGASLDKKSTTRGCQFLGCRLISWQCKKQIMVANSITKAEYVAASSCCGQVL